MPSSRPSVLRGLALAAIVPLALTFSSCGEDEAVKTAAEPASSAAASASATATDLPAPEAGATVEPADFMELFEAAFDKATTTHIVMEMTSMGADITAQGDADYGSEPPSMRLEMQMGAMGDEPIEMRLVDGVMYMQVPGMGAKFLKMDLDDPSNPMGSALGDQLDPRAMFEGFEDSIDSVVHVGDDEVAGETLDRYDVAVDTEAAMSQLGPGVPTKDLPETITYAIWFDAEGFYRQMQVEMGEQLGSVTMTFDDWGQDVSIQAPPPNQVQQMPSGAAG